MTPTPNADEARYWASPTARAWIENETALDHMYSGLSERLLDLAEIGESARVLDIGCGTGGHSFAAARRVGAGGEVMGFDISALLLQRASARAAAGPEGGNVRFRLGDAQSERFEAGAFDAATSRFGVMFFADPPAGFANIARAVRTGGRLAFGVWGPVAVNPLWRLPAAVASARLGSPPADQPNAPGPMGLADLTYLQGVLEAAGLAGIGTETVQIGLPHVGGAAGLAALSMRIGPAARIMRLQEGTSADAAAIEEGLRRAFEPYEDRGRLVIPATLHLIGGRLP